MVIDLQAPRLYAAINHVISADFLMQAGMTSQVRFHGKRFAWFVSDVTRKDWEWLLNSMIYGQLFPKASEVEIESLKRMGQRWKVSVSVHLNRRAS